jgi:hypothetical protein
MFGMQSVPPPLPPIPELALLPPIPELALLLLMPELALLLLVMPELALLLFVAVVPAPPWPPSPLELPPRRGS